MVHLRFVHVLKVNFTQKRIIKYLGGCILISATYFEMHQKIKWLAIIKNLQITNAGEGVEKREPSYTVGGNINWYNHYNEQYGGSLKN